MCPITGQFYTIGDCYPDNPTCDNPNSPVLCDISRCVCPRRQVISDDRRCIDPAPCSEYYGMVENYGPEIVWPVSEDRIFLFFLSKFD